MHERKRTELVGNRFTREQCSKVEDYRRITEGGYSERENPEPKQTMAGQKNTLIQTSTARNRRTALQGKIKPMDAESEEPG